jgi:uncharacterized protein YerC
MKRMPVGRLNNKEVEISFEGEEVSTDGGLLLVDKIDKELNLIDQIANNLLDTRDQDKITHKLKDIIKQRVYSIISGYEDLNDHDILRDDKLYQTLIGKDHALASSSTISRLERDVSATNNIKNQSVLVNTFINSYKQAPDSIVLDFDPTDFTLYGNQESRSYHGYYGDYCYLPLIVTCDSHILATYLRPSNIDGAKHVWAVLSLLVKHIRKSWPDTKITFRADSGLCRHKILNWCERNSVDYIVGLPGNSVLNKKTASLQELVKSEFEKTQASQKEFTSFDYAASTWKCNRKVIAKCEHNAIGSNTRYIVTNIEGKDSELYMDIYCKRGDMENRIKEVQLDMFGDRMSSSSFATNQLRLFLSAISYTYLNRLKELLHMPNTPRMYCNTVRLKIIKIAAYIRQNTRKIFIDFAKNHPYKDIVIKAFSKLCTT